MSFEKFYVLSNTVIAPALKNTAFYIKSYNS